MNKPIRIAVRKFSPFESAIEKIWKEFSSKTGNSVPVEIVPMDLHPLYHAVLGTGGLAEGDWDIAHVNTDWLHEAITSGSVEDLRPFIDAKPPDDFPGGWSNSLLQMQQTGNQVFGLPFHDGPECLIYRKDLFEDEKEQKRFFETVGKPLELPKKWDDFQQIARFFQRPSENLYGTAFAGYPDGHNTVFDFCLQLWTRNGELTNGQGKIKIDTQESVEALTFYRQIMQDRQAVHPGSQNFDSVQAGLAFARGEVAMMVNWFGFASMCEVIEESKVKGRVNITGLPTGITGKTASLNVYWLYTLGAGSKNKQLCYDFISYAVNRQNDKLLTLEGGIGCRLSTWEDPEVNTIVPYYHKLRMLHENARTLPSRNNWAKIATVVDELVLKAINTDQPIEVLLTLGQQKIETLH